MLRCNTNKVIDKAMDFIRNDLIYYIVYDVEFKNDIEILQAMQESYKCSNSEWKNKNIICYENKFKEFIYNYLTLDYTEISIFLQNWLEASEKEIDTKKDIFDYFAHILYKAFLKMCDINKFNFDFKLTAY